MDNYVDKCICTGSLGFRGMGILWRYGGYKSTRYILYAASVWQGDYVREYCTQFYPGCHAGHAAREGGEGVCEEQCPLLERGTMLLGEEVNDYRVPPAKDLMLYNTLYNYCVCERHLLHPPF